jgi:hypothetical protein
MLVDNVVLSFGGEPLLRREAGSTPSISQKPFSSSSIYAALRPVKLFLIEAPTDL